MDPITTALVTGAIAGTSDLATTAIKDAYSGLKTMLLGLVNPERRAPIEATVTALEQSPLNPDARQALASALQSSGVTQNADLLQMATGLQQLAGNVGIHNTDSATSFGSGKAVVVKGDIGGNLTL